MCGNNIHSRLGPPHSSVGYARSTSIVMVLPPTPTGVSCCIVVPQLGIIEKNVSEYQLIYSTWKDFLFLENTFEINVNNSVNSIDRVVLGLMQNQAKVRWYIT